MHFKYLTIRLVVSSWRGTFMASPLSNAIVWGKSLYSKEKKLKKKVVIIYSLITTKVQTNIENESFVLETLIQNQRWLKNSFLNILTYFKDFACNLFKRLLILDWRNILSCENRDVKTYKQKLIFSFIFYGLCDWNQNESNSIYRVQD